MLIEVVRGSAIATPYLIPASEPERQIAVVMVEAKFAAIVRENAGREVDNDEIQDLIEDGRFDYDDCSVQLHWGTVKTV